MLLFADDIKIYSAIKSSLSTLKLIHDIKTQKKLCFNNQKFTVIGISRSRTRTNALYTPKGHNIQRKNEIRGFDVFIDHRLTMMKCIEHITATARMCMTNL